MASLASLALVVVGGAAGRPLNNLMAIFVMATISDPPRLVQTCVHVLYFYVGTYRAAFCISFSNLPVSVLYFGTRLDLHRIGIGFGIAMLSQ